MSEFQLVYFPNNPNSSDQYSNINFSSKLYISSHILLEKLRSEEDGKVLVDLKDPIYEQQDQLILGLILLLISPTILSSVVASEMLG